MTADVTAGTLARELSKTAQLVSQLPQGDQDELCELREQSELDAAQLTITGIYAARASRRLAAGLPDAVNALSDATATAEVAAGQLASYTGELGRLAQRRDECAARYRQHAALIGSDDLDADAGARRDAYVWADMHGDAVERMRDLDEQAQPYRDASMQAERARASAERALDELRAAIDDPFSHPLGWALPEYERCLIATGAWRHDYGSTVTRKIILDALAPSGVGMYVQEQAVRAMAEGRLSALDFGGSEYTPDGNEIRRTEHGGFVVGRGMNPRFAGRAADPIPQHAASAGIALAQGEARLQQANIDISRM